MHGQGRYGLSGDGDVLMTSRLVRDGLPMTAIRLCLAASAGLLLANCANQNVSRGGYSSQESREFGAFSHSKYGKASQRVVAEGQEVPKGGGRDLTGKTYRIAGRTYTPYEKAPGPHRSRPFFLVRRGLPWPQNRQWRNL